MAVAARPRPSKKWSIAAWGLVAAFAVVLSYVVSLCLALACLALPLLLFNSSIGGFGALLLAVFGVVVGITIIWSLIPRRDKFEPPGVRIDLSEQRRLAEEVEAIAGALGEPMPAEVYLIPDVNAFVAQRGGFLGAGSRRVMGLGLPLMQVLTLSQFRAVLAHEFAHFYSGDTRLGPWVFKTRSAMARVINSLGQPSAFLRFLARFGIVALAHTLVIEGLVAYWKLFMRITQLISRRQEYRSDELACYIAGSDALIEGLQGVNKASAVLGPYWSTVVVPAVNIGYRPQLADGFGRFMNVPAISQAASDYLARQLASPRTDPLDTHPPLNARMRKLVPSALSPNGPTTSHRSLSSTISVASKRLFLKDGSSSRQCRAQAHGVGNRGRGSLSSVLAEARDRVLASLNRDHRCIFTATAKGSTRHRGENPRSSGNAAHSRTTVGTSGHTSPMRAYARAPRSRLETPDPARQLFRAARRFVIGTAGCYHETSIR